MCSCLNMIHATRTLDCAYHIIVFMPQHDSCYTYTGLCISHNSNRTLGLEGLAKSQFATDTAVALQMAVITHWITVKCVQMYHLNPEYRDTPIKEPWITSYIEQIKGSVKWKRSCNTFIIFWLIYGAGVEPGPLLLTPFVGLLYQPWVIDGDDCGAFCDIVTNASLTFTLKACLQFKN
jgi:hypothetical protein